MANALVREWLEETSIRVRPLRLCGVYEEFADDPAFRAQYPGRVHCVFHIFLCEATTETPVQTPSEPDVSQLGCEWVRRKALPRLNIRPKAFAKAIECALSGEDAGFFGQRALGIKNVYKKQRQGLLALPL